MTRPGPLLLTAALVASAGLTACGGDDDPNATGASAPATTPATTTGGSATTARLIEASNRTTSAKGMRISMKQEVGIPGGQTVPMTAQGELDPSTQSGRMTIDLSKTPGIEGVAGAGGAKQDVVFTGFTIYLRSALFSKMLGGGKQWVKIDLAKSSKAMGIDLGSIAPGGQDPTQALRYLKAASGDVREVGKEDVRGEPTTHFRATIDYSRYPALAPKGQRAAAERTVRQLIRLSGSRTAPIEIWVGDDGLVRRMRQTVTTTIAPGQRTTMKQDVEMYDFGRAVSVDVPPADQTQDLSDLASQGAGELLKGTGTP